MLTIYLGDLTYDTISTNYTVPLNVAYIAAYVKHIYPKDVEVKIFKYPKQLQESISENPPDILGLSNYSWNERLGHLFFDEAKRIKPDIVNVMGGPNIRADEKGLENYLLKHPSLDYYIPFEGEIPFANLVKAKLERGSIDASPDGCAALVQETLHYEPLSRQVRSGELDLPSPYLNGMLDEFLRMPEMIPLLETSRGCPFKCIYCTWGSSVLSKVLTKNIDLIYKEIEYVYQKDAGQSSWIFCDANFGIKPHDLSIAEKIRSLCESDNRKLSVVLWHSKNTSDRNINISRALNDSKGYIALQSTDPKVLSACGRGNIQKVHLENQIKYYKEHSLPVSTDLLIGLPEETASSHFNSIRDTFDMGFEIINAMNIRLLPGSEYETDRQRQKYELKTKYRPIFGAYGTYFNRAIFEIEESVRATSTISEEELESFKILHWLIYFLWNTGLCKPILKFGQKNGLTPADALWQLCASSDPVLLGMFSKFKEMSLSEWFVTQDEMVQYYNDEDKFNNLKKNFAKLNFYWIGEVYHDHTTAKRLFDALALIIFSSISNNLTPDKRRDWDILLKINKGIFCDDIFQNTFSKTIEVTSTAIEFLNLNVFSSKPSKVEVFRDKDDVAFCTKNLSLSEKETFAIDFSRFLEIGGIYRLANRVRISQ